MPKRLFDLITAAVGLVLAAPLLAAAALAIRLTSPGPVIYRARRIGRGGRPFTMYKLRTMRWDLETRGERVTGTGDPRVLPIGRILRCAKIDELPQLVNVLRGEMSVVGPRPEEPTFVARYYTAAHRRTLDVRPGLSSPGTLYQYAHGDGMVVAGAAETHYIVRLLPLKLALDLVYLRRASFWYDLAIIGRTLVTIAAIVAGKRRFRDLPEMAMARRVATRIATTTAPRPGAGDTARCDTAGDEPTAAILETPPGPDGSSTDPAAGDTERRAHHRDRTRLVPDARAAP
jgi:lipopolysaccharide/colanic/teichoic acid biosynthesis glycosyltransferase